MKHHVLPSLFLAFMLIGSELFACDCAPSPDNFCQSIRYNEHVALVKVVSKQGSFMNVEILESIRNTFTNNTITVIGQDGLNCSEWLEIFEVSDTLVLGLGDFGLTDTFNLSLCGRYYLFYENGNVTGNITPSLSIRSYTEFRDNFGDCATLASVEEVTEAQIEVLLFGREISIRSLNGSIRNCQVLTMLGQCVWQKPSENATVRLDLNGLKPAPYILLIESENQSFSKRIILE